MARLARSLVALRDQVNAKFPGRSIASDGWIGDAAHAARLSQHNPNEHGVVCAIDITEDRSAGVDCDQLMAELDASNDSRIYYLIHDRQIDNSDDSRTPYYGSNPHTKHLHISVWYTRPDLYDDGRPWALPMLTGGASTPTTPPASGIVYEARVDAAPGARVLEVGKVGPDVEFVQRWHGLAVDGYFGPATRNAVAATQNRNGVTVDGVVGPVTWGLMGVGKRQAPPFPLPAGHYYGLLTGPNESHGGFYAHERDEVAAIQRELIRQGCVPGIHDPDRSGWDDGRFEGATVDAVKRFQRARGLAVDGKVGPQTWAALFGG